MTTSSLVSNSSVSLSFDTSKFNVAPMDTVSFTLKIAGLKKFKYEPPTKETMTIVQNTLFILKQINEDLLKNPVTTVTMEQFNSVTSMFDIYRTKEHNNCLIFSSKNKTDIPIAFAWRFPEYIKGKKVSEPDNLIIEDPHEIGDGVYRLCPLLFLNTKARIWMMSALDKNVAKAPPGKTRSPADGAHNRTTMFYKTHVLLYNMFPSMVCLQVHGMSSKPDPVDGTTKLYFMVWNGIGTTFRPNDSSTMLCRSIPKYFNDKECSKFLVCSEILEPYTTLSGKVLPLAKKTIPEETVLKGRKMGGPTSNVEGRHVNSKTDTRRFLEIETSSWLRLKEPNSLRLAKAINDMMILWKKSDTSMYIASDEPDLFDDSIYSDDSAIMSDDGSDSDISQVELENDGHSEPDSEESEIEEFENELKEEFKPTIPTVPVISVPTVPIPTVPIPTVPIPTVPVVPVPIPTIPVVSIPVPAVPTVPSFSYEISKLPIDKLVESETGKWLGPKKVMTRDRRPEKGDKKAEYFPPVKDIVKSYKNILIELNQMKTIEEFKNNSKLNKLFIKLELKAVLLQENKNIVFIYPVNLKKIAVSLLWNFEGINKLILEDPHQGKDGTLLSSTCIFLESNAKCLILNAIHPNSIIRKDSKMTMCDGAYNKATLFYKVHTILATMIQDSFFVQLHGIKFSEPRTMILSNGTKSFSAEKSGPRMLCEILPKYFTKEECSKFVVTHDFKNTLVNPKDPKHSKKEGLDGVFIETKKFQNSIVEGRQLQIATKDTGRFLLVEMDKRFRDPEVYEDKCKRFAIALKEMITTMWL